MSNPLNIPSMISPKNEFQFDSCIITSCFDSGNMATAKKIERNVFEISTCPDCVDTPYETTYLTWFHFAVLGMRRGEELTFMINTLNKQTTLFENDHRPVFRSFPSQSKWNHLKQAVQHELTNNNKNSKIIFKHKFEYNDEKVHFAFCFPYSYQDLQTKLFELDNKYQNITDHDSIFYHRELLTYSLDGNRLDLITISSPDGITDEHEMHIANLFPINKENGKRIERPYKFQNKKMVFISARVHPGETPSSYVMDGVINFLLNKEDPRSIRLRKEYVFKLIPMLNPDGVSRGHYRVDTLGYNLNRYYQQPDPKEHPTIYAAKKIVMNLHENYELFLYVDLHAHATKRGIFVYGNHLNDIKDQVQTQLYARLIGINSPYFEYDQCNFTEENMKSVDKRDEGVSKEGSARVALFRETNCLHCYTLECNYNTCRNPGWTPNASGDDGQASPGRTKQSYNQKYTPEIFQHIGKSILIALLDLEQINPWSRVALSPWHSIEEMKHDLEIKIQFDRSNNDSLSKPINNLTLEEEETGEKNTPRKKSIKASKRTLMIKKNENLSIKTKTSMASKIRSSSKIELDLD